MNRTQSPQPPILPPSRTGGNSGGSAGGAAFREEAFSLYSDAGVRANNEDYCGFLASPDALSAVLVLSDGMGGHNCGEVASKIAVDSILHAFQQCLTEGLSADTYADALAQVICNADESIREQAAENSAMEGMGATLVMAVLTPGRLTVGHVGDSRALQFRGSTVRRLTRDHLFVIDSLNLPENLAKQHPQGHVLSQAMGAHEQKANPTVNVFDVSPGDQILLCSDGVSEVVDEQQMYTVLTGRGGGSPSQARARALVERAIAQGSKDNCSVIVVTVP